MCGPEGASSLVVSVVCGPDGASWLVAVRVPERTSCDECCEGAGRRGRAVLRVR